MLSLILALAAQTAVGRIPQAKVTRIAEPDAATVLAPIRSLFEALSAGDSAGVLRQVYPDGRVTANGILRSGTGLRQESFAQFAARLKPGEGFDETITDPRIEVDGDIAMVWAPFVVRMRGKVSNCGVDHFDLVRENGAWKVMNLTFSSRMADCPSK